MRKLLLILLVVLIVPPSAQMQEDTDTLTPITIEDLVNSAEDYYGRQISIQGHVQDLLNVRTFVLDEGAAVENDAVVVLNTSEESFSLSLTDGVRVEVTGTVHMPLSQQSASDEEKQKEEAYLWKRLLVAPVMENYTNYILVEMTSARGLVLTRAIEDIADRPKAHYQQRFSVEGTIEENITENAFLLTEEELLDEDRLLVFSSEPLPDLEQGRRARIYGTVDAFDYVDLEEALGFSLDKEIFDAYQGYTVLLAEQIQVME